MKSPRPHCPPPLLVTLVFSLFGAFAQPSQSAEPRPPKKSNDRPKPSLKYHQQPGKDKYGDPLPDGVLARLGTVRFRHGFLVYNAIFSPDGKIIASGGVDRQVCLWEASTGKLLHHLKMFPQVVALAFSPDGKTLAASSSRTHLWDVATGKEICELATDQGYINSSAFSPDGKMLAIGGEWPAVCLVDVGTRKVMRQIEGHEGKVRSVVFSPDGRTLASTGEDKTIRFWDPPTGLELRRLEAHRDRIESIAFSPDGKTLASGSLDKTIRFWDVAKGKQTLVLKDKLDQVRAVAFSPDGRILAAVAGQKIYVWESSTGKELRQWDTDDLKRTIAFSPDGRMLITSAHWTDSIRLWDPATGKEIRPFGGHRAPVERFMFSRDGKTLRTEGRDNQVLQWDLANGNEQVLFTVPAPGSMRYAVSPDGTRAATWEMRGPMVRLWETGPKKQAQLLAKHEWEKTAGNNYYPYRPLAYSADDRFLAVIVKDSVQVWETGSGKQRHILKGFEDLPRDVLFSPDGHNLVSTNMVPGRPSFFVRLWDIATEKQIRQIEITTYYLSDIRFSPDGKLLAISDGKTVHIRDLAKDKVIRSCKGYHFAFSADGKFLALNNGSQDGSARLWELSTGQEFRRFEGNQPELMSLAFAPGGRILATGGTDSTVLLWDLTGRMKVGEIKPIKLEPKDFESLWTKLGDDAPKAYEAVWKLVAGAEQAVPLLRDCLQPVKATDAKRLAQLIADLDNNRFAVRDKATQELDMLGELADPALEKALQNSRSLEVRNRATALLAKRDEPVTSPEFLRSLRAIYVLEQIASAQAKDFLKTLAQGAPASRLTQEAKAALARLAEAP